MLDIVEQDLLKVVFVLILNDFVSVRFHVADLEEHSDQVENNEKSYDFHRIYLFYWRSGSYFFLSRSGS